MTLWTHQQSKHEDYDMVAMAILLSFYNMEDKKFPLIYFALPPHTHTPCQERKKKKKHKCVCVIIFAGWVTRN